ncbi:MAG TPA: hypothetical protein VMS89_03595 [Methanoregulaceae archaeon]|nr:hypothetical protein [Methanoregulaceae archaeon]
MFDRYLNTYVDKRMKYIIEEWQLAKRNEIADFQRRLISLSNEVTRLAGVEKAAETKLTSLEERARKLEAKKK